MPGKGSGKAMPGKGGGKAMPGKGGGKAMPGKGSGKGVATNSASDNNKGKGSTKGGRGTYGKGQNVATPLSLHAIRAKQVEEGLMLAESPEVIHTNHIYIVTMLTPNS